MNIHEWDILDVLEVLVNDQIQGILYEAESLTDGILLPFFSEIHKVIMDPYSLKSPALCMWVDFVSMEQKDRMVRQKHYKVYLRTSLCCRDQNKVAVLYGAALEELIYRNPTLNDLCVLAQVVKKEYQDCQPYREGFPVTVILTLDVIMEEV